LAPTSGHLDYIWTVINLPPPDRTLLPKSPLDLVVVQLRFGDAFPVDDERVAFALSDALQEQDSRFVPERAQSVSVTIAGSLGGAVVPNVAAGGTGWRLVAGQTTVQLTGDALSVETRAYSGWAAFHELFAIALRAVAATSAPRSESRLGLRMIDKIPRHDAKTARDVAEDIRPWLRGPLEDDQLASGVLAIQHQSELEAHAGRLTVRSSIFEDPEARGAFTLLLDYDAFRIGYRRFDLDGILASATDLNDLCLQVFRHSVSDRLFEEFTSA
jgi:uncharacterized protein (TIGR04255 family)